MRQPMGPTSALLRVLTAAALLATTTLIAVDFTAAAVPDMVIVVSAWITLCAYAAEVGYECLYWRRFNRWTRAAIDRGNR